VIAYDVCRGLVTKNKKDNFIKHFATKIMGPMETNCLKVCNPEEQFESKFQKLMFSLPKDVLKIVNKNKSTEDVQEE
jgi:hypothetical protein